LYSLSGPFSVFFGLVFVFYGVNFVFAFAAFEAFRQYGYQQTKKCFIELYEAVTRAWEALKKDDDDVSNEPLFDPSLLSKELTKKISDQAQDTLKSELDLQGINEDYSRKTTEILNEASEEMSDISSDVAGALSQQFNNRISQDTKTKLLSAATKVKRVLKVVNPDQISASAAGLTSGILGVIATLKVPLAQAVTLGSSLGDTFNGQVQYYVHTYLLPRVPLDFQRWVLPFSKYGFKLVGIIIAYLATKWILAVTVCTRGGDLILQGIQEMTGILETDERMTLFGKIVLGLSVLGFTKQLILGYELPMVLWVFLSPVLVIEWVLDAFVCS